MSLAFVIIPGKVFTEGEVVDYAKLNQLGTPAVQVTSSDISVIVPDGSVTTVKLADGALTADVAGRAKMADAFVNAAKLEQAAAGDAHQYILATGGPAVYTVALSPARTGAYVAGELIRFKANVANTGPADVNVNARGAANLYSGVTGELAAGEIPINALVTAIYDGANFQVQPVTSPSILSKKIATSDSTAANIPYDNTIPQIGEGKEYLNLTYTPKSASSLLRVTFSCVLDTSGASPTTLGLFQDAVTNALQAVTISNESVIRQCHLDFLMASPGTSAITFRIRFGANAGTAYINRASSGDKLGGVMASFLTVQEIFGGLS